MDNPIYKMYYDEGKTKEVKEIEFPIVDAGSTMDVRFYIENQLDTTLNLDCSLIGKDTSLVSYPKSLKPKETGQMVIRASPRINTIKAPVVSLNIKTEYVI